MKDEETTWVGVAYVIPTENSNQKLEGLIGGYGFVAVRSQCIEEAVGLLRRELAEGGSDLVGFDWFHRLQDNERSLESLDEELVGQIDIYPVQFRDFHWFSEE